MRVHLPGGFYLNAPDYMTKERIENAIILKSTGLRIEIISLSYEAGSPDLMLAAFLEKREPESTVGVFNFKNDLDTINAYFKTRDTLEAMIITEEHIFLVKIYGDETSLVKGLSIMADLSIED